MQRNTTQVESIGLHTELKPFVFAMGLSLIGTAALAQTETTLPAVRVQATSEADNAFKPEASSQSKFTAPLLDTPKTVQVINEEIIKQRGATSLQEALKSTAGITFGNGEGGNPSGDQPFIRGMDAQSSTFVDGMRDISAGTREVFNLESVEVIKGADSAYAGRGGAGGSINLTTKKAKNENFVTGDVGLGTDSYKRGTVDLNRKLSDTVGFRLNAMAHGNDVPGRNGPDAKRWGIAPSVTFGMGTPTEVTLSWQHLQTNNTPDGGVPWNIPVAGAASLPAGSVIRPTYGNNRENWYGLASRDYEKEKSDLFTASIEHKFSDTNKFRNSLRYSKTEQDYVWTQPDDSKGNINRGTGFVERRGNARLAEVTTLQNVSEFTGKAQTGSVGHSFAIGLELAKEKSEVRSTALQPADTNCLTNKVLPQVWCASLNNPDSSSAWTLPITLPNQATKNQVDTVAIYAFDTLKFNDQWSLNAGLRMDHYKVNAAGPASTGRNPSPAYDITRSDNLFNYQLGLVYKPATNGSIYASVGTSSRPVGSMLNNGNDEAMNTVALADLAPEKTRSIELGTKWDLMDKKLGLTAAIFRNEVTNARITDSTGATAMAGNKVVNGLELGFTGQISSSVSIFGGYTYMDSEQTNVGFNAAGNGLPFPNTPKHSVSLWANYKPTQKLALGLGVNAQSSVNQGYTAVTGGVVTKAAAGYARYDAMMAYQINKNLAFQLNLYNLGDKVYYSGIRSTHYANIAAGRSAVASLKLMY